MSAGVAPGPAVLVARAVDATRSVRKAQATPASAATVDVGTRREAQPFEFEMVCVGAQWLRVGRQRGAGDGESPPLLVFNGIGANIELLEPLARALPRREIVSFDIPGVGHSRLPPRPYRLPGIARLAAGVLDHFGHRQCDAMGLSWGGAAAQQFARSQAERCRRLVLCATATGALMVPSRPTVALKMLTPRRFMQRSVGRRFAGELYGGDLRRQPELGDEIFRHIKWQSQLGYYLQLAAVAGWTSIHWLHRLPQRTLVMAGVDDPLVPLLNARLMIKLIPRSELLTFDCGHLFLLTRIDAAAAAIDEFLSRP